MPKIRHLTDSETARGFVSLLKIVRTYARAEDNRALSQEDERNIRKNLGVMGFTQIEQNIIMGGLQNEEPQNKPNKEGFKNPS